MVFSHISWLYATFCGCDFWFSASFDCSPPPKSTNSIWDENSYRFISTTTNHTDSKLGRFMKDNGCSDIFFVSYWPILARNRGHFVNSQCWMSDLIIQPLFGINYYSTKTPIPGVIFFFNHDYYGDAGSGVALLRAVFKGRKGRDTFLGVQRLPSQCGAKAERRTRDREVPGSERACAIWFFP